MRLNPRANDSDGAPVNGKQTQADKRHAEEVPGFECFAEHGRA
jgi:hypothetical protein